MFSMIHSVVSVRVIEESKQLTKLRTIRECYSLKTNDIGTYTDTTSIVW